VGRALNFSVPVTSVICMMKAMIQATEAGFYCAAGAFHIDPRRAVKQAVITHAHSDHVRAGSGRYFCTEDGLALLQHRLGPAAPHCVAMPYGQPFQLGKAQVSFHPAGHILGSAQVRVEVDGEVWVISGDYKRDPDPTCRPFEVVPCDQFITEATFAMPIYRWQSTPEVAGEIFDWWMACRRKGRTAVLLCYSLGKSQRVLAELMHYTDETVYLHHAVDELTWLYRKEGVAMLPTVPVTDASAAELTGSLVIAPPGAMRGASGKWMDCLGEMETGFASGWMRVRSSGRNNGYDRGFVLSDHADWPQLVQTVRDAGASQTWVTHGKADTLVRYLNEIGFSANVWGEA
jgi:putative mRNA 3-end processing factor